MMDHSLTRITPAGWCGIVFAAFAFLVLPSIAGSFWMSVLTSAACFAMAASGAAMMYARLGMVSLAQVALMGIGGWVALRLNYATSFPFELNLLLGGFTTMVFGWILALPALRLRGLYLALVTLMSAAGLEYIFSTFQFPNGGPGFWGAQAGSSQLMRPPLLATTPESYLRYVVVVVALGFLLIEAHLRMKPGRAWAMIRRSEAAAMAAGVNVTLYKTWAFGIAGFLAGIAGGLLAGSLGLLDKGTFRAPESIMIFALCVVGGPRFWLGSIVAAFLYRVLPAILVTFELDTNLAYVIFGAGLLHALITAPDGIAGQIYGAAQALGKKIGLQR
jgi:branched-chain amino acid transport system permease protein